MSYSKKGKLFGLSLSTFLLFIAMILIYSIFYSFQINSIEIMLSPLSLLFLIIIILIIIFLLIFSIGPLYAFFSKIEGVKIYENGICVILLSHTFKPIEEFISYKDIKSVKINKKKLIIEGFNKENLFVYKEDFYKDFDNILSNFYDRYNLTKLKT